MPRLSVTAELL